MRKRRLYVVNHSTLVDHRDAVAMTHAVNTQVRDHGAPAWRTEPVVLQYVDDENDIVKGPDAWIMGIFDDGDQAGVLGWHSTDENGTSYGRVFARPSLDAGSTSLTGPYAISSVLSHEALETLIDPDVNAWWQVNDTTLVAAEVCDPVEDLTYEIDYDGRPVTVSDFVLPAWADPYDDGPRDYLTQVDAPFHVQQGGYAVLWDVKNQRIGNVYGAQFPEWKIALKETETARNQQRKAPRPPI